MYNDGFSFYVSVQVKLSSAGSLFIPDFQGIKQDAVFSSHMTGLLALP